MQKKRVPAVFAVVSALTFSAFAAAGPFDLLRQPAVNAEPGKEYILTESDGPYLIYVGRFFNQPGRQQANDLIYELRKTYRLNAFLYEHSFVHDINQDFKNIQRSDSPVKLKYLKQDTVKEYAVLVGNFPSMEDKRFKNALAEIKTCRPASITVKTVNPPFVNSFGLLNPILPPENPRGVVDKFIESININRPYTLLRNPKPYTVQIATFSGSKVLMRQDEADKILKGEGLPAANKMTNLEKGERAAVALCQALRKQGIEAYEFHDRYSSIVTVGSFDYYGRQMPDGTVAMDPQIRQIIQTYRGQEIVTGQTMTYKPVIINGAECDMLPKVIEVPRCRRH
ncbi:MAG: hypothetical protein LBH00_04970 [Planctomycetaceae bacterium]|jgi:hypothetical protein|nr:hypothetical protein [Planctomycetaceae bacterium]